MSNKILVVDDQVQMLSFLEEAFTQADYIVRCVLSAEEALEVVKKEDFHVYLLDMKLPGIDGIELYKRLKPDQPDAIFFAMTGFASSYDVKKCKEIGFDEYFQKPFRLAILMKAVEEAIRNKNIESVDK